MKYKAKAMLSKVAPADRKKFIALIVFIVVSIIIGIICIPYFKALLNEDTRAVFVANIRGDGALGVIILLALQVLQVIIAIISGEVVQLAAGIIYGGFWGWIICLAGCALSSALVYMLVGKLGMPFVEKMVPEKVSKKLDFLNGNKRIDLIIFVLFLIPGLPKDVFTYFAPLTKMPLGRFLALTLLARSPALIASTFMGSAWTQGNYTTAIVLFVICGGLGLLGIIFRDQIFDFFREKKKEVRELIGRQSYSARRSGLSGATTDSRRLESGDKDSSDDGDGPWRP